MKKWLAACLLAIALLFVTTAAMAHAGKQNRNEFLHGWYPTSGLVVLVF